jgi:diguanylate cyclase (GGDEF)-like protein
MTSGPDSKSDSGGKGSLRDPGGQKTVVAEAKPRASRRRGILTVASGPDAGKIIPVVPGEVVTLGRSEECTMRFDDASLSRVHARVMCLMDDHLLGDAGSTNGTFVNDERIDKATHLEDGDRVQLGTSTILRFSLVAPEEEEALRRVYQAAVHDALTGVANRKHLEERLEAELAYANRHSANLSVIIVDLDHFKRVNDTYGHLAGDAVLKHAARLVQGALRTEDLVGRYGGEEFVVIARGTPADQAVGLADRLRERIASTPIVFEGQTIGVTMSGGVASLEDCGPQRDRASILRTADERLYAAKEGGRNRVVGPP